MEKGEPVEIDGLNDIYKELCELIGLENTLKLYEQYKGFQVSFPTRLYDKDYVREVIRNEFNGTNTRSFARRFGYSERWIRSIIAGDSKENAEY